MILAILWSFWGCLPSPEQNRRQTAGPATEPGIINEKTNIHFTGRYCGECHVRQPVKGGDAYLKYDGDFQRLCGRCHHGMSTGYCHPLQINAESDRSLSTPADFPLRNGNFTCLTCHDVYRQCVKRLFDRHTLRGAPYPRKTDFCYRCHDRKKYPALNAHQQLRSDGTLNERLCLYCHEKKPDEKTATYRQVTFVGDMSALCRRCHAVEGNHPGDYDHMAAVPSAKAMKHMAVMEKTYAIILPLTRDGKMTCITCHNPHEKGVIATDKPSAKGADSKYRERLPATMCIRCHQM